MKQIKDQLNVSMLFHAQEIFARQTGKMVGLEIPVIPVEHQYIVTEPHPEIQKKKKKMVYQKWEYLETVIPNGT